MSIPASVLRNYARHGSWACCASSSLLSRKPWIARPYSSQPQTETERPSSDKSATPRPQEANTESAQQKSAESTSSITICGKIYPIDRAWFNITSNVLGVTSRQMHVQWDHPLCVTRQLIEQHFDASNFTYINSASPVVTVEQNFDSLHFPADNPSRDRANTYYLTDKTLLRTHTSAHQVELFRQNRKDGYIVTADVYRRDEIDRSHYPAFHQVEGAFTWDRKLYPDGDLVKAIRQQTPPAVKSSGAPRLKFRNEYPLFHAERNPVQTQHHTAAEVDAIANHLRRSLENMVASLVAQARKGRGVLPVNYPAGSLDKTAEEKTHQAPGSLDDVRARWVEAYFPFTSPSWELELWYDGKWHEMLGCGIVRQQILIDAGVPSRVGWAFGLGLERIAMLLYGIPDIRYFWSKERRFLAQFEGLSSDILQPRQFVPYSKYPACPKDVSFWLPFVPDDTGLCDWGAKWNDNDVMDVVRSVAGDMVEEVELVDSWTTLRGNQSKSFRITYRSLHKTLTHEETNYVHQSVRDALEERLGVTLR